ncbi:MAG: hypothetical protein NZ741_13460, partial [Armatimonadetes bacterium]|nr:hypothetical protein [Armatimonadota bacterium]
MATRTITLEPINIQRIELTIVGDSPLLVHKFSEKMRKAMLEKQNKQKTSGREDRNPEEEALQCMYLTEDGRPGFPAIAIKCAMVDAVSQVKGTLT